ncbi:unnamed protein product [Candida verbasci]|uniref:Pseudouridine synthase I TruA alpha/beta domain-containing protein n=1 Tax=Candida verbasci TaxID=1227364 RepID=A0A9W4XBR7_9ASCO|nr:unnamed protein product [Candida verbasci]
MKRSMTTKINYNDWSKEELIKHIEKLENGINGTTTVVSEKLEQPKKKLKEVKPFNWDKFNFRFVAIKFAYLGWNYNGLALQLEKTPLPTVEEIILKAMTKVKLIKDPIDEVTYSKCGRTDKGVSALNQVISINLRSNLTPEEQMKPENDIKELDYISILNANLPEDIRIHEICLRPPKDFDARFSCEYRHYKYFFKKNDLDIDLMQKGADSYLGVHDFRNFCKLDGSKQLTNFTREIFKSEIVHLIDDYYYFNLQGNAFLWHQVRCMIGILLLVGQKLESPEIVSDLMNIDKFSTKPVYEMANDIPLVLYDCIFPEMEWLQAKDLHKNNYLIKRFIGFEYDLQIKSKMSEVMEEMLLSKYKLHEDDTKYMNVGDGVGRRFKDYIPLEKRDRSDSYEVINARWLKKKESSRNKESTIIEI